MTLRVGSHVRCTNHNGRHVGVVARVIKPGVMYVVVWRGTGPLVNVQIGRATLRFPREIVRDHLLDITAVEAEKIEAV